jgi:chemotaxis protein histidine kinase CheA
LKIRKVEGYQNYDKSEFESPAPLSTDDAKLEKIWKSEHSLKGMTADKEFKTYDELSTRLNRVLGLNGETIKPKTTVEQMKATPEAFKPKATESVLSTTDDDDDLSYFSRLAEED